MLTPSWPSKDSSHSTGYVLYIRLVQIIVIMLILFIILLLEHIHTHILSFTFQQSVKFHCFFKFSLLSILLLFYRHTGTNWKTLFWSFDIVLPLLLLSKNIIFYFFF
mmetsp:Transcript_21583/g.20715  ORF Transcript_21583/g.20715 Transcript_21583/m.20715 type:complete len:107 (-) Transcript_21583:131-451(-)